SLRWLSNHLVPWAARVAFHDGVHNINGVRMEIPRPPDWGGGGEFHMALGTYERFELGYLLSRVLPGDMFIDVGAHIGYMTLPLARQVGPQGRIIALEPSPPTVEILRRNVALNGFDWVTVVAAAASDHDGEAGLHLSTHSPMWNTLRKGALQGEVSSIPVATRSLDSVVRDLGWPPIAGIKLDVEGAESEVRAGSQEVLERNSRLFFTLEVSGGTAGRLNASMDTLRWLDNLGYRFRLFSRAAAGRPVGADALIPLLRRSNWQDSLINLVVERT